MPMTGYMLQTGGSARMRVIKPLNKQAATTVFPIQNEYRVSGVPGHTHNSSAVASVLLDLSKKRGFTKTFNADWAAADIEFTTDDPGDSVVYDEDEDMFDRALERGIGEIALRPENCHHEIREPVRSISEIRTLVAPHDRLQTLTYVEEVGGFVQQLKQGEPDDGTEPYISDYPNVNIDFLCYRKPSDAEKDTGGRSDVYLSLDEEKDIPILIDCDDEEKSNFVVLLAADKKKSVGTLADKTDWYGIVPFRWNDEYKYYESDEFTVTFKNVYEIQPDRDDAPFKNAQMVSRTLTVKFPALETTVASNGYCFLMSETVNPTQVLRSATSKSGKAYAPSIEVEVLDSTVTQTTFHYRLDCAYRIMVGGNFAFPGPPANGDRSSYYNTIAAMAPARLALAHQAENGVACEVNTNWASATKLKPESMHNFQFSTFDFQSKPGRPAVFPRNTQAGACWEGYTKAPTRFFCMAPHTSLEIGAPPTGGYLGAAYAPQGAATGHQPVIQRLLNPANPDFHAVNDWKITSPHVPALTQSARTLPKLEIHETDVELVYDVNSVRPTKFAGAEPGLLNDPESYSYWRKNVAPTLNTTTNAALAAADQIPASTTWYKHGPSYRGTKTMYITGTQFVEGDALFANQYPKLMPDGMDIGEQIIMVPAVFDCYYNGVSIDFTYTEVTDAYGTVDFDASRLDPKDFATSKRFYIVGDVYSDAKKDHLGVIANVDPLFNIKQVQTVKELEAGGGHGKASIHITDVRFPADLRYDTSAGDFGTGGNAALFVEGFGVGTVFECLNHALNPRVSNLREPTHYADHRLPVLFEVRKSPTHNKAAGNPALEVRILNLYFTFEENRTFFLCTNDVGARGAVSDPAGHALYFHTKDTHVETATDQDDPGDGVGNLCVVTVIEKMYTSDGVLADWQEIPEIGNQAQRLTNAGINGRTDFKDQRDFVGLCHMGKNFQDTWIGSAANAGAVTVYDDHLAESKLLGPVFKSNLRISQHLCAPILNPNMRIGCTAPLNFETGHLPPELRDFRLELRDIDFSFLPGKVQLEPLVLYEFNGGNQIPTTEDNLLHLPQFKETHADVESDGTFDFEVFSPYGMPSYVAIFCRDQDRSRDHLRQPIIKQLSMMCNTTQKQSNTILDANVHQLYHMTQRNVNPRARYRRDVFNRRQVVLLSAEDIGMMGLENFQSEKRALFRFHGTVDQIGRITSILVYNNRGLYVQGKHMSVVRLKD